MKKHFLIMGLTLAAALSLNSCKMEEALAPVSSQDTFSIRLSADDLTRNANDGMSTKWVSGDGITVWHAPAGTADLVKDGKFSTTDAGATATFTGTLTDPFDASAAYDWYIIYPWKSALVSPVGTEGNFTGNQTVGKPFAQQSGLSSSAHINGADYAIYGKASNVIGTTAPDVQMKHISSLVKVHITNNTSAAIRPNTIVLTAPEQVSIAGNHAVDYTTDPMQFWPNPSNASKSVWLDVAGAPEIEAGQSADFFFTVKPFTAAAGETIKICVNGYEKTIVLDKAQSFEAGKVKTIDFNYDSTTDFSGDWAIVCTATNGVTYLAEALAFPCIDMEVTSGGTNPVLFSKPVKIEGKNIIHDMSMVIGPCDPDATIENFKFTFKKVTEGDYAGMYTVQNAAGKYLATTSSASNCSAFQDAADANSYFDLGVTADGNLYMCATKSTFNRSFKFNFNSGFLPRFINCLYTNTSLIPTALSLKDYSFVTDETPRIKVGDIEGVPGTGAANQTTTIVIENNESGWTASIDSFTGCVTAASIDGSTVTYSVGANPSTTDEATGTIVVKLTKDGKSITATINVKQAAKPASGGFDKYYVKVSADQEDWSGEHYLLVCENGNKAYVMYTDGNYNDGSNVDGECHGCPAFQVDLFAEGIGYTAETAKAGEIIVKKQSRDATTVGVVVEGAYTFFLPACEAATTGRPDANEVGWGAYNRNFKNVFMGNYNASHSRFQLHFQYEDGSLHVWTPANGQNGNGYLRFDLTTETFGWCKSSVSDGHGWAVGTFALGKLTLNAADVQLYKLVQDE